MRLCLASDEAKLNAKRLTRRLRKRYKARKVVAALLPYWGEGQRWAVPFYIVACETRGYTGMGRFTAQNASGAYGAYQLMPSWWSYLGRKPTPSEQHQIAARVWKLQGPGGWDCA